MYTKVCAIAPYVVHLKRKLNDAAVKNGNKFRIEQQDLEKQSSSVDKIN